MPLLDKIREQKLIDLAKACFDPLPTEAEEKVLRDSASSLDPDMPAASSPRPTIRSDFVRWLATNPEAATHIDPKGLRAFGITLPDKLDLQNCRVLVLLHFQLCTVKSEVNLQSAETKGVFFLDSSFDGAIKADRIDVDGPLFLRGSSFFGEIRLLGAQIKGALDCLGAKLEVTAGNALTADRAEIGGIVYLQKGYDLSGTTLQEFESSGTIRLLGAKIKGDLSCSGAKLRVKEGNALYADSAEIGGNVFLNNGFESSGTIRLPGAKIRGDLSCSGAKLRVKEGNALYADGAEIGGSVLLNVFLSTDSRQREDFESTGTIRMLGAQIEGILSCSGAKLKVTVGDALFADCAVIGANVSLDKGFESSGTIRLLGTRIGGELAIIGAKTTTVVCKDMRLSGDMWWMGIQKDREAVLDLTGASLKNLRDDRESWPAPGHLILDGLAYEEVNLHERPSEEQVMINSHALELPFNVEERVGWLMLQPPDRRTEPQPWMQLSKLLQDKGNRKGAKHVIFKYRCFLAQKRGIPWRWLAIVGAWLEEKPVRIYYSYLFTLAIGWLIFAGAARSGAMLESVQIQPNAIQVDEKTKEVSTKPVSIHYPPFQPFIYTLENAVPAVKLGMDERWMPDRRHLPRPWYPQVCWLDWLKWFNSYGFLVWFRWWLIASGWAQTTTLPGWVADQLQEAGWSQKGLKLKARS
jgi:hypothetical protein